MARKYSAKNTTLQMGQDEQKTNYHSTQQKLAIKSRTRAENELWDEYLDMHSLKMAPANNQFKDRLAVQLIEWASKNPKAYSIEQFLVLKGITRSVYYRWKESHEKLKIAHDYVLMVLGNKRELYLIEELKDAASLRFMMPFYCSKWQQREKEVAALRTQEADKPTTVTVVMQAYGAPQEENATTKKSIVIT